MKIILTEEQLELYKKYLTENNSDEASRTLPKKLATRISAEADDVARYLYGDDYGKLNTTLSDKYGVEVNNDANVASGLFSLGNAKLSDDTLIINFTSALRCPSAGLCPVTQKACYAVAGENRLPDLRRKNLKVQSLWQRALYSKKKGIEDAIDRMFGIARMYIEGLNAKKKNGSNVYKKPIKFIRFNESGDFPCQIILEAAAKLAAFAKEYGIMSMAYSSNSSLNFTAIPKGLDMPIDKYIKINASRKDIELSPDMPKQRFLATPMDFKNVLANNDSVESITDKEANELKCMGTIKGPNGINSIPRLEWGKWVGGEGWYYVCPCSFWKYNKDKAESLFYNKIGKTMDDVSLDKNARKALRASLTPEEAKMLRSVLNKVKSPCGVECAVCHDMEGGLKPDGGRELEYAVLTSTHGSGASKFDPKYAEYKRSGDDKKKDKPQVKWKGDNENPLGKETKYDKKFVDTKQNDIDVDDEW